MEGSRFFVNAKTSNLFFGRSVRYYIDCRLFPFDDDRISIPITDDLNSEEEKYGQLLNALNYNHPVL